MKRVVWDADKKKVAGTYLASFIDKPNRKLTPDQVKAEITAGGYVTPEQLAQVLNGDWTDEDVFHTVRVRTRGVLRAENALRVQDATFLNYAYKFAAAQAGVAAGALPEALAAAGPESAAESSADAPLRDEPPVQPAQAVETARGLPAAREIAPAQLPRVTAVSVITLWSEDERKQAGAWLRELMRRKTRPLDVESGILHRLSEGTLEPYFEGRWERHSNFKTVAQGLGVTLETAEDYRMFLRDAAAFAAAPPAPATPAVEEVAVRRLHSQPLGHTPVRREGNTASDAAGAAVAEAGQGGGKAEQFALEAAAMRAKMKQWGK